MPHERGEKVLESVQRHNELRNMRHDNLQFEKYIWLLAANVKTPHNKVGQFALVRHSSDQCIVPLLVMHRTVFDRKCCPQRSRCQKNWLQLRQFKKIIINEKNSIAKI